MNIKTTNRLKPAETSAARSQGGPATLGDSRRRKAKRDKIESQTAQDETDAPFDEMKGTSVA
jgi:hypothetical protein